MKTFAILTAFLALSSSFAYAAGTTYCPQGDQTTTADNSDATAKDGGEAVDAYKKENK